MKAATNIMFNVLGGIMFCIAITLLFVNSNRVKNLSDAVNGSESILYESHSDAEDIIVPYEELISILMTDALEYDIEINDTLISKDNYKFGSVNNIAVPKKDFKKSYVYDINGNIVKVKYESR